MPEKSKDDETIHVGGTPEQIEAAMKRLDERVKRLAEKPVDKAHGRARPTSQAKC